LGAGGEKGFAPHGHSKRSTFGSRRLQRKARYKYKRSGKKKIYKMKEKGEKKKENRGPTNKVQREERRVEKTPGRLCKKGKKKSGT